MATNNSINLKTAGLASYDGAGVFAGRTLTPPAAGITVSNGDGIAGNPTLALANDLAAVEALATNGLATRTGTSTWTTRTITAGTGVSVSNGDGVSGNPTISAGATTPLSFPTDSGTATPSANAITLAGSGSITTSGSGATVTTALTGLTNHAVLVGAGSTTITKVGPTATSGQVLQSAGSSADPAFSTAAYPASTTINQLLYSSAANTIGGLATANQGVLTTGATGVPVITALATNGQLIIGSTAGVPAAATLTAGTGITITNASNSITISASSSGFSWTDVTGATQTIAAENGYITDRGGGVTYTLPASGSLGDTFKIIGKAGIATITPLALQQLLIGSASGTVGVTGTAVSTNAGDCITFVCTTSGASTVWRAESFVGNWTLN